MSTPSRPSDEGALPTLPSGNLDFSDSPPAADRLIGQHIGAYRIVEAIGHGGMGTVYRAVRADQQFQSEVAIKVIRRGLDSQFMLDRFRAERQILATLQHPNIARLLDGGTTGRGEPYLVMEYIRGVPLTAYCDNNQLSIADRLKLFRHVCDAVSYAHRNLIIHRDLKPDNILVTENGVPKLLDFGIAKILQDTENSASGDSTMTAVRTGTPAYASPEQIRGAHVGVGTDIYSLGIILYELLTGCRPYRLDSLNWEESARIICERPATRPSSVISSRSESLEAEHIIRSRSTTSTELRKCLIGDLDNILALALRKEPDRRYRSADEFSAELQKYLEGWPVLARGDSFLYRAHKFIGRHALAVAFIAVFTVLLLAAALVTIWQARRLSVRVDEDRQLAGSFLADIHDEIARLPGSTPVREALLTKSLDYLNGLSRETGNNREVRRSLALAYERFAELLGGINGAGLGKPMEALKTYETARRMRETLAREAPDDKQAQYELAANYLKGSFITGRIGSAEQRLAYDRKALEINRRLAASAPRNLNYQSLLAKNYISLAYGYSLVDDWTEATDYYRQAVPIREQLAAQTPTRNSRRELANIYYRLGVLETQSGHPRPALEDLNKALRIQQLLQKANQDDAPIRSDVAGTHHFLGIALNDAGDARNALPHFQTAIHLREAALSVDGRDATTRSLLAGNYAEQATALLHCKRKAEALTSIKHALSLQTQFLALDPQSVPARISQADYKSRLGTVYESLSDWPNAAHSWTEAVVLFNQLDRENQLRTSDVRALAEQARVAADRCLKLTRY